MNNFIIKWQWWWCWWDSNNDGCNNDTK